MPETTPASTSATAATPPVKPRLPRSVINRDYIDGLTKAQNVFDAAKNPLYNAEIVDGVEITAAFLTALESEIAEARGFLAAATSGRGDRKTSTSVESDAKIALSQALQGIQSRAYQKFHLTQPNRVRDTYYGGTEIFKAADGLLEQIAIAFLAAAPGDGLPKVDAARIANLQSLLDDWNEARDTQGNDTGASITSLEQFKAVYASLEAKRRTIQFAADDDFPYYDPINKAAREAFEIPAKSPFRA